MPAVAVAQVVGGTRTRLAVLATIGEIHRESRYDLGRLRRLVEELEPDLLGIEADGWTSEPPEGMPLEVQAALVPAAQRMDTVIVPLGTPSPLELAGPTDDPIRGEFIRVADRLLATLQRTADTAEHVNSGLFAHICGAICTLEARAASDVGRRAWEETNARILANLVAAVRRDPGRRVLAAVQCRRVHWLSGQLGALSGEIDLVGYRDL